MCANRTTVLGNPVDVWTPAFRGITHPDLSHSDCTTLVTWGSLHFILTGESTSTAAMISAVYLITDEEYRLGFSGKEWDCYAHLLCKRFICIKKGHQPGSIYRSVIHFNSKFALLDKEHKIQRDRKNIRKGLTNVICGVPMPMLQRLAQPFNELDELTVYSEVFEPFLERSLRWKIKLREHFGSKIIFPDYHRGYRADRYMSNRGFCGTGCIRMDHNWNQWP